VEGWGEEFNSARKETRHFPEGSKKNQTKGSVIKRDRRESSSCWVKWEVKPPAFGSGGAYGKEKKLEGSRRFDKIKSTKT